jgi:hypothetical protein
VPTAAVAALFRHRYVVIRRFYDDPNATFLPLSASSSWASQG